MINFHSFLRNNTILERIPEKLILLLLHHIVMVLLIVPSQEGVKGEPEQSIDLVWGDTDPRKNVGSTSHDSFGRQDAS